VKTIFSARVWAVLTSIVTAITAIFLMAYYNGDFCCEWESGPCEIPRQPLFYLIYALVAFGVNLLAAIFATGRARAWILSAVGMLLVAIDIYAVTQVLQ